ncbi:unnamed protein product, partial [Heterotrigona itama]
ATNTTGIHRDGSKGRQSQTRGNFIDIFIEYLA